MKVLGIDPGSIVTGYGVVTGDGPKTVHLCDGQIEPRAVLSLPERLFYIYEALVEIMEQHRPDAVAIESVFFARNPKSAIMLGQARGAALVCAASSGIEVFEYSPRLIKKTVTGYGNATKAQVQRVIKMLLGADAAGPDAADALAAAVCHLYHAGTGPGKIHPSAPGRFYRKSP